MDTKSGKSLKINFLPPRSGLLDSNQRPRAPQTCALPTALNPECECKVKHFCRNSQMKMVFFSRKGELVLNMRKKTYICKIIIKTSLP